VNLVNKIQQIPSRVIGLDTNTKSMAFAVFEKDKLVEFGKINFDGADINERLIDAALKSKAFSKGKKFNYIAIESSVMVRSVQVAIKMSYIVGAVIGGLSTRESRVVSFSPLSWQSFIGNKVFSEEKKNEVKKNFPGKSTTWISSEIRRQRKQFTIDYVNNKFNIQVADDDVADAICIAYFSKETR
jgi:Holliday junction resolvasome RuvABC endonuclease subunit